ncbi:SIMPL domain-containing protein (plasmid) [Bacillus sp. 31A1R]|uniref:SIMPL domain-containing protein n=1 Tax=Robertmurraya mangrovi TaxID=3098077 RepID=A0ABU5IV63_9BACI|nr:SIMPL domain-containing protein [Bacillus sp. 31A1R]MDZ5471041.1 SIMPL domain-containing protein [Bacillus sp. 31A1R]
MYYYQQPYRTVPSMPIAPTMTPKNTINEIRVTGEGILSVQPDKAEITVGVITENMELVEAQSENSQITTQVIGSLKGLNIAGEDIQTVDYSIFPLYDYIDGKQTFKGYKVEHRLLVTVRDISKVGLVVDTAVRNGANSISNIRFSVTDSNSLYQQALALALNNAFEKASTIANTIQVRLVYTPILVIEGTSPQKEPIPFAESQFVKGASTTPIEPGSLEIKSTVTAVYIYYVS